MTRRVRLLTLLLVLASIAPTTGCIAGGPRSRQLAYAGNAVLVAAGTALVVMAHDAPNDEGNLLYGNPSYGVTGASIVALGVGGIIATLLLGAKHDRQHREPAPAAGFDSFATAPISSPTVD